MIRPLPFALSFALIGCSESTPDNLNDSVIANEAFKLEAAANMSVAEQIKALDAETINSKASAESDDVTGNPSEAKR